MLICHKRVASNEAAVQACHVSDVHPTNWHQCSHIASVCHASVVRVCVPLSSSSSLIYHFWFLKHHHSAATPHHHRRSWRSCRTHENCMHAEQIIIIVYIFYYLFCSMCLVLFSIVLYRTIVTVYTDNIFLYNYLRQMHQIIHLAPLGCFTPAPGKTVQKDRKVSVVNSPNSQYLQIFGFNLIDFMCFGDKRNAGIIQYSTKSMVAFFFLEN